MHNDSPDAICLHLQPDWRATGQLAVVIRAESRANPMLSPTSGGDLASYVPDSMWHLLRHGTVATHNCIAGRPSLRGRIS